MPVGRHIQTSLASGELDPLMFAREDVSLYYNSARVVENMVPLPQGGARRREGWAYVGPQRGEMNFDVGLTNADIEAPNGGDPNDLAQFGATFQTTTGIGTASEYVVARWDLGSAERMTFFILREISLRDANPDDQALIKLQISDDDSSYTTVSTLTIGTQTFGSRTFAAAPSAFLGTARYWRVAIDADGTDLNGVTVAFRVAYGRDEIAYVDGTGAPDPVSIHRVSTSIDAEYIVVCTRRAADIYKPGTGWVAAVDIPHDTIKEIAEIKSSGSLDSLVLYQEDRTPHIIQRLGSDFDWQSAAFSFSGVVRFPFNDPNVDDGKNEIQQIDFRDMSNSDEFAVEFNGDISDIKAWSGTDTTVRDRLQDAILSLRDISSVTVTIDNDGPTGTKQMDVEFTSGDGFRRWPLLVVKIYRGDGTAEVERKQPGRPPTDELWSDTRGYPSCGSFYQGRHWMGGFRSRPDLLVASRVGDITDFREDDDPVSGSPLVLGPDIDEQVTIHHIYAGRHLQIFTSSVELYLPEEPITPENVALKITSRHGASPDSTPLTIQGGTIFVDRNGRAIREYMFNDVEQSYTAEPISFLAGHLVSRPQSMVMRRQRDVDEPTLLLIANTGVDRSGNEVPAAMCVIDRAQQVTGFFRVGTQGKPLAFETTQGGDAFVVVERELAGVKWNFIEEFEQDHNSDSAVFVNNTDFDETTASADQEVFSFTFDAPANEADIAVWWRQGERWQRFAGDELEIDLGAKEVTLDPQPEGREIRINLRKAVVDLDGSAPHLAGQEVYVHVDGQPVSTFTVNGDEVDLDDWRFDFFAEVGLPFAARIVLHPFKGQGDVSPTMQKQRIHRALLQLERTGDVAIGIENGPQRHVPIRRWDEGTFDSTLEEILFSGTVRVSGISGWRTEPRIEVTQETPMPLILRAITYDVRY